MKAFESYLNKIADTRHRARMEEVLGWVADRFQNLEPVIKWNQPMFTDHGTYIIGFSYAKTHMAAAPEWAALERFSNGITKSGYNLSKELIRIPWDRPVDYSLLEKIIAFNIADKADIKAFWRKQQAVYEDAVNHDQRKTL